MRSRRQPQLRPTKKRRDGPVIEAKDIKSKKKRKRRQSKSVAKSVAKSAAKGARGSRRGWLAKLLRAVALIVLLLIALPLLLTPTYSIVNPPSTTMLTLWMQGRTVTQQWTALDDISDRLKVSVITAEDARYCDHYGIDFEELANVVSDFKKGERPRGASTIPMQLAKNLFLWNSRSYLRKVLEVPLALYIDLILSKRRMLEIYMNIAEWGPGGRFGVQVGADYFYKQPVNALTWRKASVLATMLPSPYKRNAAKPSVRHADVARVVEKRARGASAQVSCIFTTPKTIR